MYNYTVCDCATRDNVLARVDLTLVFNIDNATTFVYKLGATHFSLLLFFCFFFNQPHLSSSSLSLFWADEMLKAVAEEALRGLVRSIDHTSIYELRASAADQLIVVLNRTVCLLFFFGLLCRFCVLTCCCC